MFSYSFLTGRKKHSFSGLTAQLVQVLLFLPLFTAVLSFQSYSQNQVQDQPNILWLVSEDSSPLIGAYGDELATTPNIDKLAQEGFLYTHAYANAPVCAPARNTILTGVYANSNGNQHMRSNYEVSDKIQFFPKMLREAGYYVTNNAKEDYNIAEEQTRGIWSESSQKAHYKNREPGQPFFAVFNNARSHEISIHKWKPLEELRHKPEEVTLPAYLPDIPEIRRDLAQYYDQMEDMDTWVGEKLEELKEGGQAENTIVFYYGDHGGVYPRSKRFVYETGTRVPLVIRIPEKFKHLWPSNQPGTKVDRLVSFVDLAPTLLSLAGVPIPESMQGHAFLGEQKTRDPEYAFMFRGRMDERYDMSRAVRSQRFRYIRNYTPHRIYGQPIEFLWRASSMQSWEQTCSEGNCNEIQNRFWNTKPVEELYDTQNDPWEINNLADDPAYRKVLEEMRKASREWMTDVKDTGFIPEVEFLRRSGNLSVYDYMRSGEIDLEKIIEAADRAVTAEKEDVPRLLSYMNSDDSSIRYWGTTGLLILGEQARPVVEELKRALNDSSPYVVVVASEALFRLGETSSALSGFKSVLRNKNSLIRTFALNAISSLGDNSEEFKDTIIQMVRERGVLSYQNYDHRVAWVLFKTWGVEVEDLGVKVDWFMF